MSSINTTVLMALYVHVNEVINHPIFGRVRIDGIYFNDEKGHHEAFGVLLDFNNTHRLFELMELSKAKFKQPLIRMIR